MTAVQNSTTESAELSDVADCVDILRDGYGASIRWLGPQNNVYRVRIGRYIIRFSDLEAVAEWAYKCECHLSTHYKERNTPLCEEWAYGFGAKGSREPRVIVLPRAA